MRRNEKHFIAKRVSVSFPAVTAKPSPLPKEGTLVAFDPALEQARAKARAWVARGMPDGDIVYDENVPKLTEAQLAEFKSASVQFARKK